LTIKPACCALFLLLFLACPMRAFAARDVCIAAEGLQVCVQVKGPCDVSHLLPMDKTVGKRSGGQGAGSQRKTARDRSQPMAVDQQGLTMDMFYVAIHNTSSQSIRIMPTGFYGITVGGFAVVMDAPLYDSIGLKTKLPRKDLGPQEKLAGFLFFPSAMGPINTIGYAGSPTFQIRLY
jgi:hypothetical protein